MIATGGTGGHIYPALALAEVIKQNDPDCEIQFFGSSNRMEATVIPASGYRFTGMEMTGMNGGLSAKVKSAVSLLKAQRKCRQLLKMEQPDICVGFGNYISVPLIMAAHSLHIPTMIHEQNSTAGKANKMLSKYADAIVGCYDANVEQLGKDKTRLYGNPEASLAAGTKSNPDILRGYGIDPEQPFVDFMMGSLGSSSVSKVIDEACALFDPSFQILIAAGKDNDYTFATKSDERIHIVPYIDGVQCLKQAALSVTRAGATTMAEIAAVGAASILIPSPFVPNNHQVYNALELVKQNAAVMIEEKDLTPQSLAETVNRLMNSVSERGMMKQNAKTMGRTDAADRMIDWMEELSDHGSDGK